MTSEKYCLHHSSVGFDPKVFSEKRRNLMFLRMYFSAGG
jgi:hypothetical protein